MIIKDSGTTNTEYLMLKISFQIQVMIFVILATIQGKFPFFLYQEGIANLKKELRLGVEQVKLR